MDSILVNIDLDPGNIDGQYLEFAINSNAVVTMKDCECGLGITIGELWDVLSNGKDLMRAMADGTLKTENEKLKSMLQDERRKNKKLDYENIQLRCNVQDLTGAIKLVGEKG